MQKFAQVEQIKKPCRVCGDTKFLSCFPKSRTCKGGYKHKCNACIGADRNKKRAGIDEMFDDLMKDPEARELMKSLNGYGKEI